MLVYFAFFLSNSMTISSKSIYLSDAPQLYVLASIFSIFFEIYAKVRSLRYQILRYIRLVIPWNRDKCNIMIVSARMFRIRSSKGKI